MTKKRSTKSAFLLSVLSLVLCLSMLTGTTFAWFTDQETSANNKIIAGNLDVELKYAKIEGDKITDWYKVNGSDEIFDKNALWEPGRTEVVYLEVSNLGNLELKYQLGVNVANEIPGINVSGNPFSLSDHLVFKVVDLTDKPTTAYTRAEAAQAAGEEKGLKDYNGTTTPLEVGGFDYVALIVYMPESVGNEANYRGSEIPTIELGINLYATQFAAEEDSFGSDYDEGAGAQSPNHDHIYSNGVNGQCLACDYIKYSEGLEFTSNGDGTCYVNGVGTCRDTNLVIPETSPSGDSVTSVGNDAFSHCTSLTSVTIPDSVTSIGSFAFHDCTSLISVMIPDSVTSIESGAFCYCHRLTNITVDENNTAYKSVDGNLYTKNESVLIRCAPGKADISFVIPDSVTSIGDSAFDDCTSLTSVTIPDSVTSIGSFAFNGCTSLISVTIPDSVTSIGSDAFHGCTSLVSVTIPDSVTSIGGFTFSHCYSLTSVTIPDSVTSIGIYAFSHCTSLTSVTIPDSVTSIGVGAFDDCGSLTSIVFEDTSTWYMTTSPYNWLLMTGGTETDVANNATNVDYFRNTYKDYYWYKK